MKQELLSPSSLPVKSQFFLPRKTVGSHFLQDYYSVSSLGSSLSDSRGLFAGGKEERLANRRNKIHTADIKRKAYWLAQQT